MRFEEKLNISESSSLRNELIITIVLSLVISVAVYLLLSTATESLLERTQGSEAYHATMDKQLVVELGNYVEKKRVTSDDWYALNRFVESNQIYSLKIYKNQLLVYDSSSNGPLSTSNANATGSVTETDEISMKATVVSFADGNADVLLTGNYRSVWYRVAGIVNLGIAFVLFILIVMSFMRNRVYYLKELSNDVNRMGEGDFARPLTIKGNDEISELASNLDQMRMTFSQHLRDISKMQEESKDVITSMSHDMRTPMTPLLVYLEMLKDRKYTSEEQMVQYAEKSYEKALQLKNMADNMFQYMRLDRDTEVELVTVTVAEAFYDQLSSVIDYLTTNGYDVDVDLNFDEVDIRVNLSYVARIFDNLVSNIQRYSDPKERVFVKLYREKNKVLLQIKNSINALADYSQSTGFGVKNIRKMADNMGAEYIVSQNDGKYNTILLFDIANGDEKGDDTEVRGVTTKTIDISRS